VNVLLTGVYGRCGTAIVDHLHDDGRYDLTYFNRSDRPEDHPYGGYDTIVGDVADARAVDDAMAGQDAVIHLAAYPYVDGDWDDVFRPNFLGQYNVLEAAREHEVGTVVFGSTNHVMGMYEREYAPALYEPGNELLLDVDDPVRPDSLYGASKSFGEDVGRYYVEEYEYPAQFYGIRICSVRMPEYDHPYGDAEAGVDDGEFDRRSEAYERQVARMKGMWHSRRDFAHEVACCLDDDSVRFDVFGGVSDNDRRWFSIQRAKERIGYDPQDNAEEWDAPPET
jgi:nucleoside-diphosphate-sugar epimerase